LNAQLGVETVQVLADAGYYNSEDLKQSYPPTLRRDHELIEHIK
jgi:hypothetical protein